MASGFSLKNIGAYPAEYKANIHGPYDPSVNYKGGTPLRDVKLGELGTWLSKRNLNPFPAISRGYWAYMQRWILPKKAGSAGMVQVVMMASLFFYANQYNVVKYHRHCKYH